MSGQRGAGSVPIPTLAFESIGEFCRDAEARGLGLTLCTAIRVQGHRNVLPGGYRKYEVHVTAFDDQAGCILVAYVSYGIYGPDPVPDQTWQKGCQESVAASSARLVENSIRIRHPSWQVAPGEWIHDAVPPGMISRAVFPREEAENGHEV